MEINFARNDDEILTCFPVMAELRTHITDEYEFLSRVLKQMKEGYHLVYLIDNDIVHSAAGFRFGDFLAWGRIMYIDDLVTLRSSRSKGYGKVMLEWLMEYARKEKCDQVHLDSGVQRFAAHRFYLNNRMDITSHHFAIKLNQ